MVTVPQDFIQQLLQVNHEETEVLLSLQHNVTQLDIDDTQDLALKEKKGTWLREYLELVSLKNSFTGQSIRVDVSEEEIVVRLTKVASPKKEIILFEALLFCPYFNLNIRSPGLDGLNQALKKALKKDDWEKRSESFVVQLGPKVNGHIELVIGARTAFKEAVDKISGNRSLATRIGVIGIAALALAVTAGYAAPFIGTALGGAFGLSGAAATSAGLAFLGGGAIAAGGTGIFGGTVFLIGGGAILGGFGAAVAERSRSLVFQPEAVLTNLAKIEGILKSILRENEAISVLVDRVIQGYIENARDIKKTETELGSARTDLVTVEKKTEIEKRMDEVAKTIRYHESAISRLRDFQKELDLKNIG